ncbi:MULTISPECIES: hypothetical protein [unclassified Streptomyces]|uniref:hypothetical protein n=1 Tax=unclassified Streptomyces TaxID=2593676 RepID=UPI0033207814
MRRSFLPSTAIKRAAATAAATVLTFTALTGTSHADAGGSRQFTIRSHELGLTSPQAEALQDRVDSYLALGDGVQVEVNKVQYSNGNSVVVPLPGEKRTRNITAQTKSIKSASTVIKCDKGWFCAFSLSHFTGVQWNIYNCQDYRIPDWQGNGSWYNNQTGGAQALFKDKGGVIRWVSDPAPTFDDVAPWGWVGFIKPC